jgi:hypothetical protein
MGYSIEAINSEDNSVKQREALQEQLLKANLLHDGKTQKDGTKVESPTAVTSSERKTDTINISTQGQLALEQIKAAKSDGTSADFIRNTVKTKSDSSKTDAEQKKTDSKANSDTKSKSGNKKSIYSMSKSELNILVSEGLISGQEVKKEMKRRSEISFPPDSQR